MELLFKNPAVAVPIVLARLKQKDSEWVQVRKDMRKDWQKIFDQNFQKSLDHCSFYFKQKDKRQLGSKTMVNEIREAAEKRRSARSDKASRIMAAIVSPNAEVLERLRADDAYDMTFHFGDLQVMFQREFLTCSHFVNVERDCDSK